MEERAAGDGHLVELASVRKSFGDNLVLDGIDLSIDRGAAIVVAGPSGSGKSTMLPILQVFIVIGLLFVAVNLALSRLSRRLEIRERRRTGTTLRRVEGIEDQVAAETDLAQPPGR